MNNSRAIPLIALLVIALGAVAGSGVFLGHEVVMAVAFIAFAYLLGRWNSREPDRWLPTVMAWGMVAKLTGAYIRFTVLYSVYGGVGDADHYHTTGLQLADAWRALSIPAIESAGFGSQGTRFTAWVTGLLYAPYEPSPLAGFWIYSLLAFLGQYLFYLAFRRIAAGPRLKAYALLIFFWPTLVYWPSSIGKEALLILFLGIGTFAASHLYERYALRWVPLLGAAIGLTAIIRVHVAALFAASVVAGALIARKSWSAGVSMRLLVFLTAAAAAALPLATELSQRFDLDLSEAVSGEELDPLIADIERRTGQGGSAVDAKAIRSPADVPEAALRVIFRPLPNEAGNLQMMVASLEGMMLLGLVIWRAPVLIANVRSIRRYPLAILSLVYTAGFVWGWSAILNYGILARQRSLLLPFLLAFIALFGWRHDEPPGKPASEVELVGVGQGPV